MDEGPVSHEQRNNRRQSTDEPVTGEASRLLEDTGRRHNLKFLCPICETVFTDPVSTPCGHNFCGICLTQHWNNSQEYHCPSCDKTFEERPELKDNTELSERVDSLQKKEVLDKPEVLCDVCAGVKQKALKSCLDCGLTFCKSHLEPHNIPQLIKHWLIKPAKNLDNYICKKHMRPLYLFCKDDQKCLCQFCIELHTSHNIVPINQTQLRQVVQQTIHDKEKNIQEIKDYMRSKAKQLKETEEKKMAAEKLVEELEQDITELQRRDTELEQEITELKRKDTELEQLSHTEDHLHLLQIYPSLCRPITHTTNWTEISVDTHLSVETVRKNQSRLQKKRDERIRESAELKRIQQYAVNVTLNPETAHPNLILSKDEKQVRCGDTKQKLQDNPDRFTYYADVLGNCKLSSKFYYEVQVKEKTEWDIGVARKSVKRKSWVQLNPESGFWTVILRNENKYTACDEPPVKLSLKEKPQKVGVFVDSDEGLVSFYDVENRSHIYSYTGESFTEKVYPFFGLCVNDRGKDSAPLIISP